MSRLDHLEAERTAVLDMLADARLDVLDRGSLESRLEQIEHDIELADFEFVPQPRPIDFVAFALAVVMFVAFIGWVTL